MNRVFVYGTLKRGGALHGLLKSANYVGDATTSGVMYLRPGYWFPQAQPGHGTLRGELYENVSPAMLESLDRAEGHPFMYRRQMVPVVQNKELYDAWIYWYVPDINPVDKGHVVKDGFFDASKHS